MEKRFISFKRKLTSTKPMLSQSLFRGLRSRAGFTIVEVLAAMTMISVSSVGLLWSVNAVRNNSSRMQLVNAVTTLESAVAGAIMEKANYSESVKAELRAGTAPKIAFAIKPQADMTKEPVTSTVTVGEVTTYSPTLEPCSSYGTAECSVRIKLDLKEVTVGTRAYFAFAYRIETKDPNVTFNYTGGGGSGKIEDSFADDEYKLVIPYDFYLESMLIGCAQGEDMAMTGVDVTTGRPICIKQPKQVDLCADGTMPKSLRFIEENGERRIALNCGPLTKDAECPTNYFLQQIDTRTLDGASTGPKQGVCVYAGATTASTTVPTRAKRISGQVCPPGYRSRSTCTLVDVTTTAGTCSWCWGSALDCGSSVVSENPIGSGNFTRTTNYFCSDPTGNPMPANPGHVVFTENSPVGSVDCYVHHAQQDCNATWDAMVQLDVVCEMYSGGTPAETVNVQ